MKKLLSIAALLMLTACGTSNQSVDLPENFPKFDVMVSNPDKMQPGYMLFDLNTLREDQAYMVIVDQKGDVVWYYEGNGAEIKLLPNGNLLFLTRKDRGEQQIVEMTLQGEEVRRYYAALYEDLDLEFTAGGTPVETIRMHHEVFPTVHGTYLTLGLEAKDYPDYWTTFLDPADPLEDRTLGGDVVVEFDENGTILRQYSLLDMLDPYRISYGSLNSGFFGPDVLDWSHGNAVFHHPEDDSILVSLRHQDAVVKFDRQTGDLIWILGNHENWEPEFHPYLLTPVGDVQWQYHQHAPEVTSRGTIMLYDNGNYRASPPDAGVNTPENYSRAVEYAINEDTMEVEQIWDFSIENVYTPFIGDADYLENGNVLVTFGGIVKNAEGVPIDVISEGDLSARIVEVTQDKEIVFDMQIKNNPIELGDGWKVYRTAKIPLIDLPPPVRKDQ